MKCAVEYEAQREAEQKKIKELSKNGEIIFSQLPLLDKATRKALLGWVSKALAASDRRAKTDQGPSLQLYLTGISGRNRNNPCM